MDFQWISLIGCRKGNHIEALFKRSSPRVVIVPDASRLSEHGNESFKGEGEDKGIQDEQKEA